MLRALVLALVLATVVAARPQARAATATPSQGPFDESVERWRPLSREAARTAARLTGINLDEDLLLALVEVESGGHPTVRSARGGVGLTAIESADFADLHASFPGPLGSPPIDAPDAKVPALESEVEAARPLIEEPLTNLIAGALHLAECARAFGADLSDPYDLTLSLHAYRFGPRATAEALQSGGWLPGETVEHAARIEALYRQAAAARLNTATSAQGDPYRDGPPPK